MPSLPKFLRDFFQRDPSPPPPRPGPTTIAVKQVSAFLEAVRSNDQKMILELFNVSKEDKFRIKDSIEVDQGIQLHIESAVYTRKGDINVQLRFSSGKSKTALKWLLTPSKESPTGWKVKKECQARFTFQIFFKI